MMSTRETTRDAVREGPAVLSTPYYPLSVFLSSLVILVLCLVSSSSRLVTFAKAMYYYP
jgi:hypothetical protein